MSHIEVLATDGIIQKRVLWIDIRSNGVYSGFCFNGSDMHTSYHADGNIFNTYNGKTIKIATFPPLKDLKDMEQIGCFGFSSEIREIPCLQYKMKKLDAATFIDVRAYKKRKKDVGCTCCVVKPQSTNFISAFTKDNITTEIHVFTNVKPWILIRTYEIKTDRFDVK
jgi:hypothetical protein